MRIDVPYLSCHIDGNFSYFTKVRVYFGIYHQTIRYISNNYFVMHCLFGPAEDCDFYINDVALQRREWLEEIGEVLEGMS